MKWGFPAWLCFGLSISAPGMSIFLDRCLQAVWLLTKEILPESLPSGREKTSAICQGTTQFQKQRTNALRYVCMCKGKTVQIRCTALGSLHTCIIFPVGDKYIPVYMRRMCSPRHRLTLALRWQYRMEGDSVLVSGYVLRSSGVWYASPMGTWTWWANRLFDQWILRHALNPHWLLPESRL